MGGEIIGCVNWFQGYNLGPDNKKEDCNISLKQQLEEVLDKDEVNVCDGIEIVDWLHLTRALDSDGHSWMQTVQGKALAI